MAFLLILCGTIAAMVGVYRGFVLAREALGPLVHDGDPTRTALDASKPFLFRPRVRRFTTAILGSIGWLIVALYGMFLIYRASELIPG